MYMLVKIVKVANFTTELWDSIVDTLEKSHTRTKMASTW